MVLDSDRGDEESDDSSTMRRVSEIMADKGRRKRIEKLHQKHSWAYIFKNVAEFQGILADHETPQDVMANFSRRERGSGRYSEPGKSGSSGSTSVKPDPLRVEREPRRLYINPATGTVEMVPCSVQTDDFDSQISREGPDSAHLANALAHRVSSSSL
jgi:hypothetical protein